MNIPMEARTDIDARDLKATVDGLKTKAQQKRNEAEVLLRKAEALNAEARGIEEGADQLTLRVERLVNDVKRSKGGNVG